MKKTLIMIFALFLLVAGIVLTPTPMPGTTLFIAIGLALLIHSSPMARLCIQWLRGRFPRLNRFLFMVEAKIEKHIKPVGRMLKETHPLPGSENQNLSHRDYIRKKMKEEKIEP